MEYMTDKKLRVNLDSLSTELKDAIAHFKLSNKNAQYGLKLNLTEMTRFLLTYEKFYEVVPMRKNGVDFAKLKVHFFAESGYEGVIQETTRTPRAPKFTDIKFKIMTELDELKITANNVMKVFRAKNIDEIKDICAKSKKKPIQEFGANLTTK